MSKRKVWDLVASGDLKTVKLSKRCTRFREQDVVTFIDKRTA